MKFTFFYKPGELEFEIKARQLGYELEYVGDESSYWPKDIDFIAEDNTTIEVKWDSRINHTNNLFVEIVNPRSPNGLGWYRFIEAEWLAYGNSKKNEFYMIKVKDLKEYVETHNLQRRITSDCAEGFLLPLNEIEYKTI